MRTSIAGLELTALAAATLAGALLTSSTASADGMPAHARHAWHVRLPPEHHVIEGVKRPGSGVFLINGRYFASTACPQWTAGDRITLVAGDWHGYCSTATFHNLARRDTCTMMCPGRPRWWWLSEQRWWWFR